MKKHNLPNPQFEAQEADRLIANFGIKPAAEKKQEIEALLKSQKEQFLAQERQREHGKSR